MGRAADITTSKGRQALKARHDPYYHKIAKSVHVGIYKPGTGTLSWRARVFHHGKNHYATLEKAADFTDATAQALRFADQVREGEAPTRKEKTIAAKGSMSVKQLIEEYINQDSIQVAKGDRYKEWRYTSSRLSKRYVYPYLGERPIRSLTADDLKDLQTILRRDVSAETVNRGLVTLRAALNYGLAKGYLQAAFWKTVPLMEEAEQEDKVNAKQYFDLAAREAFLEAAGEHLEPLVRCMYLTGCRPSEARRLTVNDVHADKRLKHQFVRFKTFKGNRLSGTGRKFPLANGRLDFFRELVAGKEPEDHLFTTPSGIPWSMANLNKAHNKVRDELAMDKGFQVYCWRHAWITDMIQHDVQPLTVAKLAGTSLAFIQSNYTVGDETLVDQIPEI